MKRRKHVKEGRNEEEEEKEEKKDRSGQEVENK